MHVGAVEPLMTYFWLMRFETRLACEYYFRYTIFSSIAACVNNPQDIQAVQEPHASEIR
jgi:hypothetical protein